MEPMQLRTLWSQTYGVAGLLILASTNWLLSTYFAIEDEFTDSDLAGVLAATLIVIVLQLIVILLVQWTFCNSKITAGIAAVFLALNAYSLNLCFNQEFVGLGWLRAALLAGGAAVAFALIRFIQSSKLIRYISLAMAGILAVISPILNAAETPSTVEMPSPPDVSTESGTASANVRVVKFTRKPNVYFIGFESMAPAAVVAKYMDYHDYPMPDAFARAGYRTFPNLFAERVPTKWSLNRILALDADYYEQVRNSLFYGAAPSPLMQIFQYNGYETSTLYKNTYLGPAKGPYVHHYITQTKISVCKFMTRRERRIGFFGMCNLWGRVFEGVWRDSTKDGISPVDFLMNYIEEMASRSRPQLLFAHIDPLLHVDKDFRWTPEQTEEFRREYSRAAEQAATNLLKLTASITEKDPNAILFVFGDHGPYLSRGVTLNKDNKVFWVQDRYAVLGGIYPANTCKSIFDSAQSGQRFLTTPQIARLIVQCLSDGEDPLIASYDYKIQDTNEAYEEYLYD